MNIEELLEVLLKTNRKKQSPVSEEVLKNPSTDNGAMEKHWDARKFHDRHPSTFYSNPKYHEGMKELHSKAIKSKMNRRGESSLWNEKT